MVCWLHMRECLKSVCKAQGGTAGFKLALGCCSFKGCISLKLVGVPGSFPFCASTRVLNSMCVGAWGHVSCEVKSRELKNFNLSVKDLTK